MDKLSCKTEGRHADRRRRTGLSGARSDAFGATARGRIVARLAASSLCALGALASAAPAGMSGGATSEVACPALLSRSALRLQDEKPQSLCQYSGKVVVVVNTASQCGFTPQYRQLEALNARYRDQGLVVLGFPSNDFGAQEPGSNRQIAEFCENQFAVRFPMFVKGPVRGASAQPFFADLARLSGESPGWNFHKFVIDRSGRSVRAFGSDTDPLSPGFTREIERLLAESSVREKGRAP